MPQNLYLKLSNQIHGSQSTVVITQLFDVNQQCAVWETDQLTKQLLCNLLINLHTISNMVARWRSGKISDQ